MLSALLALTVSISPGPSALGNPSPVGGSLTGIFTADDYPPDALDLNQEGSVGVLVRVDPKGAVSDCMVTSSSGFPALDAQTCRVVWLRAVFTPARDASGVPVTSTYQQSIHWAIGDDDEGETSDPYMVRWIVSGWQNDYPSCRTNWAAPPRVTVPEQLDALPMLQAFRPPYRDAPRPLPILLSSSASPWAHHPPSRWHPQIRSSAGSWLASISMLRAKSHLVRSSKQPARSPQLSRACLITAKQYARKKDAKGTPAPFTAYFMINLFGR